MKRLSFITKVQRVPVSELPFETLTGNKTFPIPGSDKWPKVKCQRPAKLEITDKLEDGVRKYTHKLTLRFPDDNLDTSVTYAYLVTDLESNKYLIGVGDRPYPVITMSDVHPDSYGSSTMIEATITWTYTRKAPKIE